jgi:hypothetical protein
MSSTAFVIAMSNVGGIKGILPGLSLDERKTLGKSLIELGNVLDKTTPQAKRAPSKSKKTKKEMPKIVRPQPPKKVVKKPVPKVEAVLQIRGDDAFPPLSEPKIVSEEEEEESDLINFSFKEAASLDDEVPVFIPTQEDELDSAPVAQVVRQSGEEIVQEYVRAGHEFSSERKISSYFSGEEDSVVKVLVKDDPTTRTRFCWVFACYCDPNHWLGFCRAVTKGRFEHVESAALADADKMLSKHPEVVLVVNVSDVPLLSKKSFTELVGHFNKVDRKTSIHAATQVMANLETVDTLTYPWVDK